MDAFKVFVRESQFPRTALPPLSIVGELDAYTNFDAISRHNDVGSWSLDVPSEHPYSKLIQPGRGIVVYREDSTTPVFSGPIRKIKRRWNETDAGAGTVEVSGVDDNVYLAERLAWTNPENDIHLAAVFQQWQTDLSWKNVGELLYNLLKANTQGQATRRVERLFLAQPSKEFLNDETASITRLRFNRIDELIRLMSAVYDMAVRCVWHPDPSAVAGVDSSGPGLLVTFVPSGDLTGHVRFSIDNGNLRGFDYTVVAPNATRLVIGTQARKWKELERKPTFDDLGNETGYTLEWVEKEGPERWFGSYTNRDFDPKWWGIPEDTPTQHQKTLDWASAGFSATEVEWGVSAERYKDRRDIPWQWAQAPGGVDKWHLDPPVWSSQYRALRDEVDAFNLANGPKAAISIDPVESPALRYHLHYQVGDYVRVNIDGTERNEQVTEVRLSAEPGEGPRVQPSLGTYGTSETPYLYRSIRNLWGYVNELSSREDTDAVLDEVPPAEFVLRKAA